MNNTTNENKRRNIAALALIIVIFILSLLTSRQYGFTWDESWDLYLAQRNLQYALSLDPDWMNFDVAPDFSMEGKHPDYYHVPYPWRTLNFGPMLAAISDYVFFIKLNLVDPIFAIHFPNKILFGALLISVYIFVRREIGYYEAGAAVIAVAFQPRFWADMQFNLKDFPYACFMAFTIFASRSALLNLSWPRTILAAILLGMAAAVKPNAVLLAVILPVWALLARSSINRVDVKPRRNFYISLAAAPLISSAVYIFVWPYLWADPVGRFSKFLEYYLSHGTRGPDHFQWDKLFLFISVQPPVLLLFGVIGIAAAIFKIRSGKKRELHALLLMWFLLPVLRVLLPKAYDYDGVRHFIEYAVPLGILAGIGFVDSIGYCYKKSIDLIPRKFAVAAISIVFAIPVSAWAYSMTKSHPFEIAYFNFMTGGLEGAQKRWPDATDYWGSSYRQGAAWFNENAEPDAFVATLIGKHIVEVTQSIWMRKDLILIKEYSRNSDLEIVFSKIAASNRANKQIYLMYITRRSLYDDTINQIEKSLSPVYSITSDGAPILKIYRFDSVIEAAEFFAAPQ